MLARRRYKLGVDSYLAVQDAQRQWVAERQEVMSLRRQLHINETNLYRALRGKWQSYQATNFVGTVKNRPTRQ